MKTLYSIILLMLVSILGYGQVPEAFSYQALIRNASGDILANTQVTVQISILQDSESGSAVYVETFKPTTTQYGLIALKLGKGSVQSGTFNAIDWVTHSYFVKIEIDPNNGTDYTNMGTSQLLAVPYALYTKSAANVFSGNYYDLTNTPTVVSAFSNDAGYLTSFTETDPVFGAHAANGVTAGNITNWNSAFGWGNHADEGYLTSFTETDPIFGAHEASGIAAGDITKWNEAHSWGDHAAEGYLTSFTETDPVFGAHAASGIVSGDVSHWNEAYGWGDHGAEGYITDGNTNWNNSYGFITDGNTNWNNSYGFITASSTITGLIRSTASGNSWITGGNVGIGTTNPIEELDINGTIRVTGIEGRSTITSFRVPADLEITMEPTDNPSIFSYFDVFKTGGYPIFSLAENGSLYIEGTLTQGSSRELKENITELTTEEAFGTINGLKPFKYTYKGDKEKTQCIGFIAEDVPDLVATPNRRGVKPMDFIAILTKIVQEQQKMISALEDRVKALEK